jgi:hypothetical protein
MQPRSFLQRGGNGRIGSRVNQRERWLEEARRVHFPSGLCLLPSGKTCCQCASTLKRLVGTYSAFMTTSCLGRDPSKPLTLEAWTTLTALAGVVPGVRIGTRVSSNTFRHPAVLAKMAAQADIVSGGRFVLGLGAGPSRMSTWPTACRPRWPRRRHPQECCLRSLRVGHYL